MNKNPQVYTQENGKIIKPQGRVQQLMLGSMQCLRMLNSLLSRESCPRMPPKDITMAWRCSSIYHVVFTAEELEIT